MSLNLLQNLFATIVIESDELVFVLVSVLMLPDYSPWFIIVCVGGIWRLLSVRLRPLQVFSIGYVCSQS